MDKISIRFFNNHEVRAIWDDETKKWWFSVIDIVKVLSESKDARNYWYVLKNRFKKSNNELLTNCKGFKMLAEDEKMRETDCFDNDGISKLIANFPSKNAKKFLEWFTYSDNTVDGQSKMKAYDLFESNLINEIEVGTIKGLQQIHSYIFRWNLSICR